MSQPMSFADFRAQLATFDAARRARDLRLGTIFLGAVLTALLPLAALLVFAPEGGSNGARLTLGILGGLAALVIAGEAAYVTATSRAFHRRHAPRCPSCGRSVGGLGTSLAAAGELAQAEAMAARLPHLEARGLPDDLRPKVRALAEVRCRRCKAVIAAPTA